MRLVDGQESKAQRQLVMPKRTKQPKKKTVRVGEIGICPPSPEPWPSAFQGEPIPGLQLPYPPRLYSQEYSSPDFYKTEHGEYFIGFWPDGAITLCQHDKAHDLCRTADGKTYMHGGKYGGPLWIMPLEFRSDLDAQ